MRRILASGARLVLALCAGAVFAYLAWNPQPPPPKPGERIIAQDAATDEASQPRTTAWMQGLRNAAADSSIQE